MKGQQWLDPSILIEHLSVEFGVVFLAGKPLFVGCMLPATELAGPFRCTSSSKHSGPKLPPLQTVKAWAHAARNYRRRPKRRAEPVISTVLKGQVYQQRSQHVPALRELHPA